MGGFAAGGGASSALGTIANLYSSKILMKYQLKLQRKSRRKAYQDTMFSMREAGLNPILAYQKGPTGGGAAVSLGSGAGFRAGGVAAGAQADAAQKQASSAKGLRGIQGEAAAAQRDLTRSQQRGEDYLNVAREEMANWYQTDAGKVALHGKGIGGIWGPPAAAAEQVYQNYKNKAPKISFPGKVDWRQAVENRRKSRARYEKYEGFKYYDRRKGGNVFK